MTRMDCGEVRDLLQPYEDGELPAGERTALAQHLAGCPQCKAALGDLQALRQRVRAAGTYAMPAGLDSRVRTTIGIESGQQAQPWGWRRYAAVAATHAVALLVGGALAYGLLLRSNERSFAARDIVSAHVRSLMMEPIVQVASADTHTVKPWFAGKVPFAPDVKDLGPEGFPLLGGRVDFVLERPAAAIVYGRRKHRINLFMLPAEQIAGDTAIASSHHGYNIIAWARAGFRYFAVSDLNAAELQTFATAQQMAQR